MRFSLSTLLGILALLISPAQFARAQVGMVKRSWVDDTRKSWDGNGPRPLTTTLWYPTTTAPNDQVFGRDTQAARFVPIPIAAAAPPTPSKTKYPLLVLSHGTGGSAASLMWLGRELALRGYVVAAVDHHGNTAAEPKYDARGFRLVWERPKDLSRVIDRTLADPLLGSVIDRQRIGMIGFSLGGYSVLAVAGGRLDLALLEAFCRSPQRDFTCEPQPEFPEASAELTRDKAVETSLAHAGDSVKDARVRAVFAIAPVMAPGMTDASLHQIHIPVAVVVGAADRVAPPETQALRYAREIPAAQLSVLPGAVAHTTFLMQCTELGQRELPLCRDAEGVDRAAVHSDVAARARAFFDRALGKSKRTHDTRERLDTH